MLTHTILVDKAKEWLSVSKSCNPVFTERGSAKSNEMPDALGWSSDGSFLVEVKISKADFLADAKKPFRQNPETGMGKFRYYLFPYELFDQIPREQLPEGWGIVTMKENGFRPQQVRFMKSKEWEYDKQAEIFYLRSRIMEVQRFGR